MSVSLLASRKSDSITKCYAELLAPEILAMIFHDVIALHERNPILVIPVSRTHQENEFDTKPLLSLSHVCGYWRYIALGNPALWRRIHGRCRDQLEVFLKRSHPLTVTLFADVQHCGGKIKGAHSIASIINTHGPRLHRLDLSMVPTQRHVIPLLGYLQAPHLECLTLTSPRICNSFEEATLSWTSFKDLSSLRALAIMPVVDWMPSCTFPHLTHLFISFDRDAMLYHPFDVLRLLSKTPMLTFLHVNFLLFNVRRHPSAWQPPSDPISLRHLRSLVFTSCSYDLMHTVLSHLSLPQDVFIRLQDVLNRDNPPLPFPPLPLRPVTSLDLCMGVSEVLVVADGSTSGLWFEGHHDDIEDEPINWGAWLLRLYQCLTLSHVTYLHISIDGEPIFWPEFLAHLPQVSHLDVLLHEPSESDRPPPNAADLSSTAILCRALSPSTTSPIRCPLLRTLTIEWHGRVTAETAGGFLQIPVMLTARAHAGHPVHHLIVQAAPHPLSSDPGTVTALDVFDDTAGPLLSSDVTGFEMAEREDGMKGFCAFEMRDVWRVDGEDKYWEVDDYDKPRYVLPSGW